MGKDGSHDIGEKEWEKLPEALQRPLAITRLGDKDKGYRLYTTLKNGKGEYIVVGVAVKNSGRDIEVNAISTVFGRRESGGKTQRDEVIYTDKEITPEQKSLLNEPNLRQYPTTQESNISEGKDNALLSDKQISKGESSIKVLRDIPLRRVPFFMHLLTPRKERKRKATSSASQH